MDTEKQNTIQIASPKLNTQVQIYHIHIGSICRILQNSKERKKKDIIKEISHVYKFKASILFRCQLSQTCPILSVKPYSNLPPKILIGVLRT